MNHIGFQYLTVYTKYDFALREIHHLRVTVRQASAATACISPLSNPHRGFPCGSIKINFDASAQDVQRTKSVKFNNYSPLNSSLN